jgi:hypothetical protein
MDDARAEAAGLGWYLRPPPDDPDYDPDAILDEITAKAESREFEIPGEDGPPPGPVIGMGAAWDADPGVLAKLASPQGLAGMGFGQDGPADTMRPGPLLAALTVNAAENARSLSDDELSGAISAARRLQAHAEWMELAGTAEFGRRQEARFEESKARGDKKRHRAGEYPECELGFELGISPAEAANQLNLAAHLDTRLKDTFAGMRNGLISGDKAKIIHGRTCYLSDEHAALADKDLAKAAPGIRRDSLYKRAVRLSHKLDPEADKRHKEDAALRRRRVEVRREDSGNGYLAGRELDNADVLAAKAAIWEEAARLRRNGAEGSLDSLRSQIYMDRLLGRASMPPELPVSPEPHPSAEPHASPAGGETPLPVNINMLVYADMLAGMSDAMSEIGGFGLLDSDDTRVIAAAASRDPRTRWCVTVIDRASREAVAHGCARGRHPWTPPLGGGEAYLAEFLA